MSKLIKHPKLIIGNKNYSSWSFRAWLTLRKTGITFDVVQVNLFSDGYKEKLLSYAPTGQVPIYQEDKLVIWDTMAIVEYIAEFHPELWPETRAKRAMARSVSAEMHAGFHALRSLMPMNCRATNRKVAFTPELAPALNADIQRIQNIWQECRVQHQNSGPWLFGDFSIADVMYAPVVSRFNTYGITCSDHGEQYMQTVLNDADVKLWMDEAALEPEVITQAEVGQVN
ncbi:glutathione S-transferase family protein [Paraglaciecola sp.]|uniref:glutathione S-transferase family protein n=1 Tax=Paraglaciecola sp. TaxID=1920173 RepID=UPI003EF55A60